MLEQGKDFIRELAGQEDGRIAPKNNRLVGAWLPGSFTDQRLGENKVKRLFNPCKCPLEWQASGREGNVLVSLPYSPSQEAGHYVCL